ncbi:formylglycine-generating enzyme family protein [Roseofilum sp. Guam]|uniref:formylglycine-generating enzyme family protein n=1 Tax=Roseofilum sp. Guam TaxID=2821502 RepID=UPI001B2BB1A9|nr:formylglycine-generating enzyme family protein [Roseofilum sp. Guam]MBP0030201.1 formylglycine-generating enzyme family protein [Roseofilum sp. Guam]
MPEPEIAKLVPRQPPKFTFEVVTVNGRGEITERKNGEAQYYRENLGKGIYLDMVKIPEGTFLMGSPKNELERSNNEGPQHQVRVSSFFMGRYAITQAQWKAVVNNVPTIEEGLDPDPSVFKGENRPVDRVSWQDAVEFCARLSQYTGRAYGLPSEAQWEYACRAGTTTPFHFGETLTTDIANYYGNSTYGKGPKGEDREQTTAVGSFGVSNGFGLYDMHGNVWEWCADPWHSNYEGAPEDRSVWDEEQNDNCYNAYNDFLVNLFKSNRPRVIRGGSWEDDPGECRSAFRSYGNSDLRFDDPIGLRVVRLPPRTF